MSERPPVSLRLRLIFWMLVPLLVMALALIAEAYFSSRKSVDEIHDRMLLALAWLVSEHAVGSGGDMLPDEAMDLISASTNERVYYLVEGPDSSFLTGYSDLPRPPKGTLVEGGDPVYYNAFYDGEEVRMLALRFLVEGRDLEGWTEIRIAQTRDERNAIVHEAVVRAALRLSVVIFVAAILAIIGVNKGLAPLVALQEAIRRRSYDDLSPIQQQMPKEVRRLVGALNGLLERLSQSIETQRRFIANASHQLRTPLAVLQAEAELALRTIDDDKDRAALETIHEGTRKTSRLANQLLSLTRVRSQEGHKPFSELDLLHLAQDVTRDWVRHPRARGIDLGFESDLTSLPMQGDAVHLREMLSNLIDNALHYGGERITVSLFRQGSFAVINVEDNGPGIPAERREEVFERFVRLDERVGEGCGLGLDIVREIALLHGGRVSLKAPQSGPGLLVHVALKLT